MAYDTLVTRGGDAKFYDRDDCVTQISSVKFEASMKVIPSDELLRFKTGA